MACGVKKCVCGICALAPGAYLIRRHLISDSLVCIYYMLADEAGMVCGVGAYCTWPTVYAKAAKYVHTIVVTSTPSYATDPNTCTSSISKKIAAHRKIYLLTLKPHGGMGDELWVPECDPFIWTPFPPSLHVVLVSGLRSFCVLQLKKKNCSAIIICWPLFTWSHDMPTMATQQAL